MEIYTKRMDQKDVEDIKSAYYKLQSSEKLLLSCMKETNSSGEDNSSLILVLNSLYEEAFTKYNDLYARLEKTYLGSLPEMYEVNTMVDYYNGLYKVKVEKLATLVEPILKKKGFELIEEEH